MAIKRETRIHAATVETWLVNYLKDMNSFVETFQARLRQVARDEAGTADEQMAGLAATAEEIGQLKAWTDSNLNETRAVLLDAFMETVRGDAA